MGREGTHEMHCAASSLDVKATVGQCEKRWLKRHDVHITLRDKCEKDISWRSGASLESEKQLEQQSASNKALYQLDHHSR